MTAVDYNVVPDGELFKWEKPGLTLEGVLNLYEERETSKGAGNLYEVRTPNGIVAFFAPSLLHKKLRNIPIGNIVKITYTKSGKTNSGNELKYFEVGHAPATDANLKALGLEILIEADDEGDDE